jgi:glycosyltransferase involved in cell wall biosynthesis
VASGATVHLVYPHGPLISAPDSVGREVGRRLEAAFDVRYYDWDSYVRIKPRSGDVLIGHAHPSPGTCFRASLQAAGWSRRIMLSPFNHDPRQVGFLDRLIPHVDAYLAITGSYWFDSVDRSVFSHWLPKMVHVDMAIEPDQYPLIKKSFNPPGRRRFVYIGHSGWQKNTGYLTELARLLPGVDIGWIGGGETPIAGLAGLGPMDFSTQSAREVVAGYDFLLTVGLYDANPTTVLEAMSWGLIPVCTPQSGYYRSPGIANIPAKDSACAVETLSELNHADEGRLLEMQRGNRAQVEGHFGWDRFAGQVLEAVLSTAGRPMGHEAVGRRLQLRWGELISPYSPVRANGIKHALSRLRTAR